MVGKPARGLMFVLFGEKGGRPGFRLQRLFCLCDVRIDYLFLGAREAAIFFELLKIHFDLALSDTSN